MTDDKIILLKGRDCTSRINAMRQLPNGRYEVSFAGDKRKFIYLPSNVRVLHRRLSIGVENNLVLIDGEAQNSVVRVDDYGSHYKIVYKTGFHKSVGKDSVKLIKSCLDDVQSKAKFNYFKEVAGAVGLHAEDGKNILESHYERIDFIREDTILANYLSGEIENIYHRNDQQNLFPFGFNESQKLAIENAMSYRLSVIQGPPGTGKTQTILNLIANIIKSGKTVAVVSNNNSATDNVYEKLQANDVNFIAARLGSMKNKQSFVFNQCAPSEEKLFTWKLESFDYKNISNEISTLTQIINNTLKKKNHLAAMQLELDSILVEAKHFSGYYKENCKHIKPPSFRASPRSERLLDLWQKIETRGDDRLSFFDRLWALFFCFIKIDDFYSQPPSEIISSLQKLYYKVRTKELEDAIKSIRLSLLNNDIDGKIRQHADLSMKIFRSHIAERYLKNPRKANYSLDDLWKHSKDFIEDYPVVLSTTYSLRNSLSNNYVYDYVIIDEASQVDLATFVLALSCAKNAVIVGDQKQLPNVINAEARRKDQKIFSQFTMPDEYMFSKHSALSTVTDLFGSKVPSKLLREHYRCHPKIIGFCNQMFYDDQLIILTPEVEDVREPLKIYKTVKGNHARENHVNQRQIDVIMGEVIPNENLNLFDGSVGVVTPYRNQARALSVAFDGKNILAATVDKFQGRERDVIVISTVDNKISDFASNPNRLNVAVSRAKKQLIVVTNGSEGVAHTGIDDLIDYIVYNDGKKINSKTYSVFDNLYSAYYKRKVKMARVGSSPAEDLMFDLLTNILIDNNFTNLSIKLEYPLSMLIDVSKLTGRERQYASNNWTKIDFVIFIKTSKQPILAIEVDGYSFHSANSINAEKQRERDAIKNKLLQEAGIPLMRFNTTGSNERVVIVSKIKELLKGGGASLG